MVKYVKKFIEWLTLKAKLEEKSDIVRFSEREVWMCHFGENIGYESCGKNKLFHRPVIILHKFGAYSFFAIPLSTKLKDNDFYVEIETNGVLQSAMISQMRVLDVKRLHYRKGKLGKKEFEKVRSAFLEIFKDKK